MTLIWIGIALLAAAAIVVLMKRTAVRPAPVQRQASRRIEPAPASERPRPTPVSMPAPAAPRLDPALPASLPAALADFRLLRAEDLPAGRRQAYASKFRNIPRPPKLLHHLVSPDFVNAASSAQLVDLIIGEPLIAARVLTVVNSPMFALKTPVSSIGQAVTYLGLNTVRSLCLQYILISSFKADSPERKQMLDTTWTASAVASGLTQQLSHRLGFEDRGSLVSAVVLSFLGQLATTASMSREELASISSGGLLERTISEQKTLGLGAAQIGRLLMNDWGLPVPIIDDAAEIDAVMVTPGSGFDADRGSRLALCYLCARLGERFAAGELKDLIAFDPREETAVEFFHLQGYLAHPALQRLTQAIRMPEVSAAVQQMMGSMRH